MLDNVTEIKLNIFARADAVKCRPAISKETILATRQEFFFTKVAPV